MVIVLSKSLLYFWDEGGDTAEASTGGGFLSITGVVKLSAFLFVGVILEEWNCVLIWNRVIK